jgi:hypothetical protein
MVKTQADAENHQYADHFRPRIKTVYPGIPVKVKENGHNNSPSFITDVSLTTHENIPSSLV